MTMHLKPIFLLDRIGDFSRLLYSAFKARLRGDFNAWRNVATGCQELLADVLRRSAFQPTGLKPTADPDLIFFLDSPSDWNLPTNKLMIAGWCFSRSASITSVRVSAAGQVQEGVYGTERTDVLAAFPNEISTAFVGLAVSIPVKRGRCPIELAVLRGQDWVKVLSAVVYSPYFPLAQFEMGATYKEFIHWEQERLVAMRNQYEDEIASLTSRPLISVIMPTYRTPLHFLTRAVESVTRQIYPQWELCIVDDCSKSRPLEEYLKRISLQDQRIRVRLRETNGNISVATNDGIAMARGDWLAFLDHDDELSPDALLQVARVVNRAPDCDVIYSDQDKIDDKQRRGEPFFKPAWSPEYFRGVMYLGHLLVVRRSLMERYGGFDSRFDTVQDFELALRLSEHTSRIEHIPLVLYHWRAIPGSVAASIDAKPEVSHLQQLAVQNHLDRLGIPALARPRARNHLLQMIPRVRLTHPQISILIPTRDHPELISRCLATLFTYTSYPAFEVLIGDNDTRDIKSLKIIASYPVTTVSLPGRFHFARFNNLLASKANGRYLVLLNNDTEILQKDWLEHLLLYAEQKDVGAVGPLLTYPDGTVQHAGVILGPRGTADHLMRGFPGDSYGNMGSLACSREVTAISAACLMISREKYFEIGGLNERFQHHYEDVDFCLRLRRSGWRNIFVASTRLIHHESKSRGTKYDYTDRILLLDQWESAIDRGDEYYNLNFDANTTDYRLSLRRTDI